MNGWIKIHRGIVDHWLFQDERYFKWWITILLYVNHEGKKFPVNGELVTCNPGESFRSVDDWAAVLKCHKKTLYKFFNLLENDSMIKRKTVGNGNRRKHLLTVVNWDKFQEKETEKYTESAPGKYTESVPLTRMNKNEKNKEGKTVRFIPPDLPELTECFRKKILEKGKNLNPEFEAENFLSFYSSKNWFIGKNKMTNYKSAVTGWVNRAKEQSKPINGQKKILTPITEPSDYE